MDRPVKRSPLALTVLSLLVGSPLHPYAMQRLIRQWGKDQVINVGQRANLYKTIKRLHKAGLIAVLHTERNEGFPERTVYELTDEGRRTQREWLAAMLQTPRREFPEFPVALSFVMLMSPADAATALERRAQAMAGGLTELESQLQGADDPLPRVVLLETEYLRAVGAAELTWLRALIEDLRTGALDWSLETLDRLARSFYGSD